MAKQAGTTFEKRRREQEKLQKRKEKQKKRELRKLEKENSTTTLNGEDPDIAGIVPGPQPSCEDDNEQESLPNIQL